MFDELFAATTRYSTTFSLQGLSPQARAGLGLLTCMDTRIEPLPILGLRPGDAKILRNAGGRVTPDVLRSFVLAATFLSVRRILIMHHTRCALANTTDAEVMASLSPDQRTHFPGGEVLAMPDPDAALAADVEAVRSHPALPGDVGVEGWRYDVDTGAVLRVVTGVEQ